MPASEDEVMKRAREIFQREHPGDQRWGKVTKDRKTAFRMGVVTPGEAPVTISSPEQRAPYIERARAELDG